MTENFEPTRLEAEAGHEPVPSTPQYVEEVTEEIDPYQELFRQLLSVLPPDVRAFASLNPTIPEIKQEIADTMGVRNGFRNEARMAETELTNPQYVQRKLDEYQRAYEKAKKQLEEYQARIEGLKDMRDHYVAEAIRLDKRSRNLQGLIPWKQMVDRAVGLVSMAETSARKERRREFEAERAQVREGGEA